MEIKKSYLINEKTITFKGVYVEHGKLFTLVVESDRQFLVAQPPLKVIDYTLLNIGYDYNGALKSSKQLLGNRRKMHPIKIDGARDIWIFSTQSHKNHDSIWFVLNHIHRIEPLDNKKTKVFLSHNHTYEIQMRESSFRTKRDTAEELRDKITKYTKGDVDEQQEGLKLVEKRKKYRYTKKNK